MSFTLYSTISNMSSTIVETSSITEEPEYVYFHYDGKYGNKREVLRGSRLKNTFDSIPLIDCSGLYSPELSKRQRTANELASAAESCGFFFLTNHGVDQGLIDDTYATAKAYFSQSIAEKMEQHIYKNPGLKGYEPVHGARLDNKTKGGKLSQLFQTGSESHENLLIVYKMARSPFSLPTSLIMTLLHQV